jgi:predicted Zn-dependent protease
MRAARLLLLTAVVGCVARGRPAPPAAPVAVAEALALNHGGAWWEVDDGPLALWVQPRPAFARAVVAAADEWDGIVRGLRFVAAPDSASASVVVVWRRSLAGPTARPTTRPTAGRTTLSFTRDGRTVHALVELALRAGAASPYTPADVHVVAQHELGHVLGLAHHAALGSVMAPAPTVATGPSRLDRAALRLLYEMRNADCGARTCTASR